MVEGTAKLIIDLGNSETRVITKFGKNTKGEDRTRLVTPQNRFGIVPEDKVQVYLNTGIYTEEDSSIFKYNDQVYCNGAICDTEFSSTSLRPTSLEKKYTSLVTKLTCMNAFKIGYESVADIADCDLQSVSVDWDVTLLLPPEDVDLGAKPLGDLVRTIKTIEFILPSLSKIINIGTVTVLPEGFCAYAALLFENKTTIRPEYAYLTDADSITLIIDIGAGTSDISMAKGMNIVTSSRFTRTIGGNNVSQRVRKLLREKGIVVSDIVARASTVSGEVKSGAKVYDITEEISQAKEDVSKQLVDAIREFFEENMFPVQQINNLFVVGGGAEGSNKVTPISKYIVEYMTQLSPNIELVKLPEINGKVSPRLLNVYGAAVLS